MIKKGLYKGRQRYRCLVCKRQFQNSKRDRQTEQSLWRQNVYERQTRNQLSTEYNRCKNWIRKHLRNTVLDIASIAPQPVTLIADVTFFRRSFGPLTYERTCIPRKSSMKPFDVYQQGRRTFERQGFTLQAIVLDGRPGVRQVFHDILRYRCVTSIRKGLSGDISPIIPVTGRYGTQTTHVSSL